MSHTTPQPNTHNHSQLQQGHTVEGNGVRGVQIENHRSLSFAERLSGLTVFFCGLTVVSCGLTVFCVSKTTVEPQSFLFF